MSAYNRKHSGLKEQFENGTLRASVEKPRKNGKKKPDDFEFQDFSDLSDIGNGDFINGEFEVVE